MILVAGGTGFIGQSLLRHLVEDGRQVRALVRPSDRTPRLPQGVPMEVALSSITDERGMRAAMVGVDTVYHLVGAQWYGAIDQLYDLEILGTRTLVKAAQDAGVKRIIFLSHLGAERGSAYPLMKAKGIAEEHVRHSEIDFTILRAALVFGPGDNFTTSLAQLFYFFPFFFPTPGEGDTLLQPLWVEDLATCLTWALDNKDTINHTFEIGGPEYFTIDDVVVEVMEVLGLKRTLMSVRPSYMRLIGIVLEYLFPGLPVSVHWLDYLASNRTCAIDSVPRFFGLMPARFTHQLDYLKKVNWRREMWRDILRRPAK